MTSNQTELLLSLHSRLKKILRRREEEKEASQEESEGNREEVREILRILSSEVNITGEELETSKIGRTIKEVKREFSGDEEITSSSRKLVGLWKVQYRAYLHDRSEEKKGGRRKWGSGSDDSAEEKEWEGEGKKEAKQRKQKLKRKKIIPNKMEVYRRTNTYTITFGDQAENHVGMQKIGSLSNEGFTLEDMKRAQEWFEGRGVFCEMIALHEVKEYGDNELDPAYVLVARNGVSAIGRNTTSSNNIEDEEDDFTDQLFAEQMQLNPDRQAFMYGKVVNKHARYNLCFGNFNQQADYENGKGTVVSFDDVSSLETVRRTLPDIIGEKAMELEAEGNYYYDLSKCGIGYHGDAERRKVIAVRLGADMELCYAWFQHSKPISEKRVITLCHGDMYVMSEKATGQDWRRKNIATLRHAAGSRKYTQLPSADDSKKNR